MTEIVSNSPDNPVRRALRLKVSLEDVLDAIPALIYCEDLQGRIFFVNQSLARAFGLSRAYFDEKPADAIFPKASDFPDAPAGPESYFRVTYQGKTGSRKARMWKMPLGDQTGEVIGFLGFAIDITELLEIQETLRQSEEKYRNFFKTSRDCVYMTSLDGRTLEFNDTAVEMFGYDSREELARIPVQHLYRDASARAELTAMIKSAGFVDQHPVDMKKKDGTIIHTRITVVPVFDESGGVIGYQGVIQDVTELKHTEKERAKLEARLRQAQKMEAVATLAGGIAHDFNNLLFSIMGSVELAIHSAAESQLQQLSRAHHSCMEAKKLIHRFLELKSDSMFTRKSESMTQLIEEATAARMDRDSRYTYLAQPSPDLPPAWFVRDQILQVIESLLDNAEESMPEGGTIQIEAETEIRLAEETALPAGRYIKVSISDQGCGISAGDLDKVFDPYFSTKQRLTEKGRGFGLSRAYAVIKQHRGDISIASSPGEGTAVRFYLPASC